MPKEAKTILTVLYDGEDFDDVVMTETEVRVWLSPSQCTTRHLYSGVPAKRATVLYADGFFGAGQDSGSYSAPVPPNSCYEWTRVIEVTRKKGRFDGAERTELVFRWLPARQAKNLTAAKFECAGTDESVTARLVGADGAVVWEERYGRLRRVIDGYDMSRLALWHWTRYYRMLDRDDAEQVAAWFAAECAANPPVDLNDANRRASRMLYQAARDRGWRKLTTTEQTRYGVEGQWHRADTLIDPRGPRDGNPSGCGDYTIQSAGGAPK